MSWRWWATLLGVCVATAAACGNSDRNHGDPMGGSIDGPVGGNGGTSQGEAGEQGDRTGGVGALSSGGAATLTSTGSVSTGATLATTSGATGSTTFGTTGGGPPAPAAWTCSMVAYADGSCDCGCGAPDPDCGSDDIDACESCSSTGSCNTTACPGTIDPEDTTHCIGWTCSSSAYNDGSECHCGCGIVDPDCEDSSSDSCDVCYFSGSCAGGSCPSSIDEDDNSRCEVPENWSCSGYLYGDGVCHCGCGVVDMDCGSASRDDCEVCWGGCTGQGCPGPIDQDNNAICSGPSVNWLCAERFYRDGSICHCGCGAFDPDCGSNDIAECDGCDFEGSCSARECPGTIDPENIVTCAQPPPPPEWTCSAGDYADGRSCDCGCGAVDLDCPDEHIDSCEDCYTCSYAECPNKVDPDDIASCLPPPAGWECEDWAYLDGYACHCGCGVLDPDCESLAASSCLYCLVGYGSCSEDVDCSDVLPDDNTRCVDETPAGWTCDSEVYADGACDCGCGVRDPDCLSTDPGECEFCDAPGSCSDAICSDLDEDNNAVCVP